ncbi:DUF3953 domain-containing protein [Virgibacillus halodenitrificans]|uniref:DUF3953 domain-containing protein n=1 Tax=Virgibacillus halodenitrificans TaxID=1482 RepID=A0ABR7VJW6_VIRHA|nr:DUF3953 domain-containing protein [Virgibacillus halodenitrificans]MBD1221996.1 DUF3953 domain-containing protein [Virgibacillus halodenitrificans]MCJ0930482.1 DUF3953 domain-containing protein [Virgibacillus halodenitrificans]
MKILRITLAIVIVTLSSYSLITGVTGIMPYVLLLIGLLCLLMGITEFRKRKPTAFTMFLAAGFSLFVGVYTL